MVNYISSDPDVGSRAGWPPHKSVEESLEIIRTVFSGEGMWAVEMKDTSEVIGSIGYLISGESNLSIGVTGAEIGGDKPVRVMRLDYVL